MCCCCDRLVVFSQDEVGTFPNSVAFGIMEEDLGVPPQEVFDFVYPDPIASASIGQVRTPRRSRDFACASDRSCQQPRDSIRFTAMAVVALAACASLCVFVFLFFVFSQFLSSRKADALGAHAELPCTVESIRFAAVRKVVFFFYVAR